MQRLPAPQVIVIGGAPGAGKSTLGRVLAARLNYASLSMDDLYLAAKAVTSPHSNPAIHCMRRVPSHEYFTDSSPRDLVADALSQHAALWPAIEAVIRAHVRDGPSLVLEGWFVTPRDILGLDLPSVTAIWLAITESALLAREQLNSAFFGASKDPARMRANFMSRSLWHDRRIREQASELAVPMLSQDGTLSAEALCDQALFTLSHRP